MGSACCGSAGCWEGCPGWGGAGCWGGWPGELRTLKEKFPLCPLRLTP